MTTDEARSSWLDTRISRRRLVAVSALAGIGAFVGYKLLGGFGAFRINRVEARTPRLTLSIIASLLMDSWRSRSHSPTTNCWRCPAYDR